MGTTALTTARSECQPHACHVSFAKIYWGEICGRRRQYLFVVLTTKVRGAVASQGILTFPFKVLDLRIHFLTQRS